MGIMFGRSFSTLTLLPGSPQLVWQGHLKWFSSTAFQHKFTASHSQSSIALQTYQPSSPCMDKPFCLKSFHAQTISKPFAQGFNQMVSACHLSEGLVDPQTICLQVLSCSNCSNRFKCQSSDDQVDLMYGYVCYQIGPGMRFT